MVDLEDYALPWRRHGGVVGDFEGCLLMPTTSFRYSLSLVLNLSNFISLIMTLYRMLNMYLDSIGGRRVIF